MKLMTITRLLERSLLLFAIVALLAFAFVERASLQTASADNDNEKTVAEPTAQYAMDWRVTGPTGGDVRALVVDPNDASRFYFGTLDGQIYTSTDGGQTWRLFHN